MDQEICMVLKFCSYRKTRHIFDRSRNHNRSIPMHFKYMPINFINVCPALCLFFWHDMVEPVP